MDQASSTYCGICNLGFSGPIPAQQHFLSDKHKKKERMSNTGGLPTTENLLTDIGDLPDKEFEFSGYSGRCFVCKSELTSAAMAEQHLSGKTHKKAKERWERVKQAQAGLQLPMTSQPNIIGTLSSGNLNKSLTTQTDDLKVKMKDSAAARFANKPAPKNSNKCYDFDAESQHGWCFACETELKGMRSFTSHVKSDSHAEKEKEWLEKPEDWRQQTMKTEEEPTTAYPSETNVPVVIRNPMDGTTWYNCDVCSKPLNTLEQLQKHYQSPKHLKQVERRRSGIGLGATDPNRSFDSTIWHTCPQCNKKLNSAEQLDLHMRSHGGPTPSQPFGSPIRDRAARLGPIPMTFSGNLDDVDIIPAGTSLRDSKPRRESGGHSPELTKLLDKMTIDDPDGKSNPQVKKSPSPTDDEAIRRIQRQNYEKSRQVKQDCKTFNCTNHCEDCNKHHTGDAPYKQHLRSKGHAKKKMELEAAEEKDRCPSTNEPFATFYGYCELCKVPYDTEDSRETHIEGRKHQEKVMKTTVAPNRELPTTIKNVSSDDCDDCYNLIKKFPRAYQNELYEKAMEDDVVCFLPTGTGKTLVSVMVLSHMLQLNPSRPAVFLVDKVLLAFQQYNVIKTEIGEKEFERLDEDKKEMTRRRLRIALVCSGKLETGGEPLWKQDVIVATAAFFENLLMKGVIRWEDQCLIILDESHHCVKDHPYQRVMRDYHAALQPSVRPKVLGLTASPAGKQSILQTKAMLRILLNNLGDVHLVAVEKETKLLQNYCSNTKLVIRKVDLSAQEEQFQNELQRYFVKCFRRLSADTNILSLMQTENIQQELDEHGDSFVEIIQELLEVVDLAEAISGQRKLFTETLKIHTKDVSAAILSIREVGLNMGYQDLISLCNDSYTGSFKRAKELNLPCGRLLEVMDDYRAQRAMEITEELDLDSMPVVKQLVHEILDNVSWEAERPDDRPIVLVLVRQRKYARKLAVILNEIPELTEKGIQCTMMIGHAAGTNDGMSVKQQERLMTAIKNHEYQVIVATSIAEEGLDLPECSLVVQMDPPNNVKSLVQIRGRARKRDSRFVALCRDDRQVASLESLQQREGVMIESVRQIIAEDRG